VINDFDRFFLNLPPFDRENDFNSFWNEEFLELKKIPVDPVIEKKDARSSAKFEIFNTSFNGAGKCRVKGELYIPKNSNKPRIIILIHDYNHPIDISANDLETGIAYYFLQLRGHEYLPKQENNNTTANKEERKSPGYMKENIMDPKNYYVKNIFLDAFRAIDFLRLSGKIECDQIGIFGKGIGAAAALFASVYSDRIKALVLDSPAFSYLDLSQNISKSDASNEINSYLSLNKSKKKQIKKNLSYFDTINHSDRIKIPVLTAVGLKDTFSPPECIFALFNHLLCEKTIEVYPEDDHVAGGLVQFLKAIRWSKTILLGTE
jgi:cephalosporin-C deacetylase